MPQPDIRDQNFPGFSVDVNRKVLLRGGEIVDLPPKAVEMLIVLLRNRGKVVTKQELLDAVWGDTFVEESVLSNNVYMLRKAIGQIEPGKQLIRTIPRRGYKFEDSFEKPSSEFVLEHHVFEQTLVEDVSEGPVKGSRPPGLAASENSRRFIRPLSLAGVVLVALAGLGAYSLWPGGERNSIASHHSFEDDDKVITDFGFAVEKARAIVVQTDGRIVLGGWAGETEGVSDFALARYMPDGSLDPSFGSGGKTVTTVGPRSDVVYSLALQTDGKIIAAGVNFDGTEDRRFCVARYKTDGSIDPSFDGDGFVTFNVGDRRRDTAYTVAVQLDGKILVAGSGSMKVATTDLNTIGQNDFGLARLNADGSLDTTFGSDGAVITNFGFGFDIAYALALQPDGKIVLGGGSTNGADNDFALVRYLPTGQLDPTFGIDGKVRTDFGHEDDTVYSLTLQPDGKILAAGYSNKNTVADFAVARYLPDGSLDPTFNSAGTVRVDIDGGGDVAFGIRSQADGRIVVGGQADTKTAPRIAVVRLMPDGKVDLSFASAGKSSSLTGSPTETWGMDLVSDKYALTAGNSGVGRTSGFALTRIHL